MENHKRVYLDSFRPSDPCWACDALRYHITNNLLGDTNRWHNALFPVVLSNPLNVRFLPSPRGLRTLPALPEEEDKKTQGVMCLPDDQSQPANQTHSKDQQGSPCFLCTPTGPATHNSMFKICLRLMFDDYFMWNVRHVIITLENDMRCDGKYDLIAMVSRATVKTSISLKQKKVKSESSEGGKTGRRQTTMLRDSLVSSFICTAPRSPVLVGKCHWFWFWFKIRPLPLLRQLRAGRDDLGLLSDPGVMKSNQIKRGANHLRRFRNHGGQPCFRRTCAATHTHTPTHTYTQTYRFTHTHRHTDTHTHWLMIMLRYSLVSQVGRSLLSHTHRAQPGDTREEMIQG